LQEQYDLQNSSLQRELLTLQSEHIRLKEENERLASHYEVLKEHELSIIKDYEAKLKREQLTNQNNLNEIEQSLQYEREKSADTQQVIVKLQEENYKIINELNKAKDQVKCREDDHKSTEILLNNEREKV
jgi:chromosome segregation ATPase